MNIERKWKEMLKSIHEKGRLRYKDDAKIKEILNVSEFIDNPAAYVIPGVTPKKFGCLSRETFLECVRTGIYDIDAYPIKSQALADYVESLDDNDKIYLNHDDNNAFVYTYPERLRAMTVAPKNDNFMVDELDQLEQIIERLKNNPGSNRAVATLYNIGLDACPEKDIPCLNWMQALIRDDELFLVVMFRSNDIYNAFPSNMLFLMNVGYYILEKLQDKYPNLCFTGVYYNCTSAHYYTDVVTDEIIEEVLK